MNQRWIPVFAAGLLALGASAQNATQNASGGANAPDASAAVATLTRGDYLTATLSKPLDADKAKIGDPVAVHVAKGDSGLPGSATLIGHISEVQVHTGDHAESSLTIVFDKLILSDGQEAPFTAVIVKIEPRSDPPREEPRKLSTLQHESSVQDAQDRAAPADIDSSGRVVAHHSQPTSLEMEADRAHFSRSPSSTNDLKDIFLKYQPSGSTFMSPKRNVKLKRGTILTLRFIGPTRQAGQ